MTKYFPTNNLVFATVATIPSNRYFFVRNGDPGDIFCHDGQGGVLEVGRLGQIILNQDQPMLPPVIGDKIVLVRESNNRAAWNFTRAFRWAKEEDWEEVKWAVNAHTVFRAIAFGHRHNGQFQKNTGTEVELIREELINIINQNSHQSNDPLGKHYSVRLGRTLLSYEVRWERQDPDGTWTECDDPRPIRFEPVY